jgi:hypothetical protein
MAASHIGIDTVIETGNGCFCQNGFGKDLSYFHLKYYNGEVTKWKVFKFKKFTGSRVPGFSNSRGRVNMKT